MWALSSYFLYLRGFLLTLFSSRTLQFSMFFQVSNLIQTFQTYWVESSNQYSLVIWNSCSTGYHIYFHPYCTSFPYQFSIITMIYFIQVFKSFSSTFLVAMSNKFIPPSHQSILCIFHFSPFITKCTIISMCLVCLLSLPILAIHTADFLSNIVRVDYSVTIYVSLFKNSRLNILKCAKVISAAHAAL